jgi:hypothetical protein
MTKEITDVKNNRHLLKTHGCFATGIYVWLTPGGKMYVGLLCYINLYERVRSYFYKTPKYKGISLIRNYFNPNLKLHFLVGGLLKNNLIGSQVRLRQIWVCNPQTCLILFYFIVALLHTFDELVILTWLLLPCFFQRHFGCKGKV